MITQDNIETVKAFFAAADGGDEQGLLALCAEDIEWIIPGDWAWAGTHRGHAGVIHFLRAAPETVEISTSERREFVARGDRVVVLGVATGRIKATNKTFEDHFVFSVIVRDGKVSSIQEYVDTLALAQASETAGH
jgi:ketosteroid isomerase-like protein